MTAMIEIVSRRASAARSRTSAERGCAHLGVVAVAVPIDRRLASLANRLVGNDESGRADRDLRRARACEFTAARWSPAHARRAGGRMRVNAVEHRLPDAELSRAPTTAAHYVAVRGGIDVEPVLGSRSSTRWRASGRAAGDGDGAVDRPRAGHHRSTVDLGAPVPPTTRCAIWPGPRHDWFTPSAGARSTAQRRATVSPREPGRRPPIGPAPERRIRENCSARGWSRARSRCRPTASRS